jgi:outer membrane protein TolC
VAIACLLAGCASRQQPDLPKIDDYLPQTAPVAPASSGDTDSTPAEPQPLVGARALPLETCVEIALDRNPVVRAAAEGVAISREQVGEALAPFYPEVGLDTGYSRFQRHAFLPNSLALPAIGTIIGPEDDWSAGFRARYVFFDSGAREAQLRAARARQGVSEEEARVAHQDLVLSVRKAFYGLAAALEGQRVANENRDRAADHLRLAEERKAAGAVPLADVVRARVAVAEADLAVVQARSLVQVARGGLNTAMGLPVETDVTIAAALGTGPTPAQIVLDQALQQAVQGRPELKAALNRIAAARQGVSGAQRAFGPKLRTEAGYGWRDSQWLPEDEEWQVGVAMEWPLFNGKARMHRLARSKAELRREEAQTKYQVQRVREEVWSAYARLQAAFETVETQKVRLRDAEESERLARERYEVGAGIMTDLLDTQTALFRANASLVQTQWDYHTAQAEFQRSLGAPGLPAAAAQSPVSPPVPYRAAPRVPSDVSPPVPESR